MSRINWSIVQLVSALFVVMAIVTIAGTSIVNPELFDPSSMTMRITALIIAVLTTFALCMYVFASFAKKYGYIDRKVVSFTITVVVVLFAYAAYTGS
ncbi:hypothetical protein [Alteribacter aurantiacus]|uniref:hypothetical protein n=1 Tax=Alteribacter aurantiacus TaxID=254410 RepID=UPI00047E67D8|nr:hypothetical protein [Alteribacter aurantiacus]